MSNKKIKVAFIFRKSNIFLSGNHFDNTYYHFFMNALKRNERIDVTYFPTEEVFDSNILKSKFDIVLLYANQQSGMPKKILNIQNLSIPVISMSGDPYIAKKNIHLHELWKIDYYFHFYHESLFYDLYPKKFPFKTIFFGIEPSLFQNVIPFYDRIKNKILNTGAIGNPAIPSKILAYLRSYKWNAYRVYRLRAKCNKLDYVDYNTTLSHEYVNDKFTQLLQQYCAVISATTFSPNMKYWESMASGCLTFMEITESNKGNTFGFIDGKTSVFINEKNYQQKFEEYLNDVNNPKWELIASQGRQFALKTFSNDQGVSKLVDLMEELL